MPMALHEERAGEERYGGLPDPDGGLSPLCASPGSHHHGSPGWGCAAPAPDACAPRGALSPAAARRAASEFLRSTTGMLVPFASDADFRAALRDGVLLCRMASTVWGGAVAQYLEAGDVEASEAGLAQQRAHNVSAFLSAVEAQLGGLPQGCGFAPDDLLAGHGDGERPAVAACVLAVRDAALGPPAPPLLAHAGSLEAAPMTPPTAQRGGGGGFGALGGPGSAGGGPGSRASQQFGYATPHAHSAGVTPPPRLSYGAGGGGGGLGTPQFGYAGLAAAHHHSPLMASHGHLGGGGGAGSPGALVSLRSSVSAAAAARVTKLMQQCTNMLKDRMFPTDGPGAGGGGGGRFSPAGAGPDSAMKALGPVLEGVLGHLTEEYEKRLLAKDHDLSRVADARARAEREAERLQARARQGGGGAAGGRRRARGAAAAQAAADAAQAQVARLEAELAEARAALAQREAELAEARASLDGADAARGEQLLRLQGECARLRGEVEELQGMAERYRALVEENRALYNTVQDLRGNIRVFCRIRPAGATGDLSPCCIDVGLEGELAIYDAQQQHSSRRLFKVDRVFDQRMDQASVYADTQPLIRSVLDGYNVCIFAYGQTGSGKTHTMSGTCPGAPEGRGINYRALDDLFGLRDARAGEYTYTFRVQMLEIYNEALRDLLGGGAAGQRLDILATQASGCNVPGATQVEVSSARDVASLMARGGAQRATSETRMNDRSSRSHQILTVVVDGHHAATGARSHGCLHLIDLAGSERVSKSEASGDRLTEAQHINRSLSALGDVMAALAAKDRHVPYRNSKLTQLLQDSLQGQAKVMMFMHISPEANQHGESVSTLKFAARVSEITLGQAKKNVVSGKVFEAHEEALRAQRTAECKDGTIASLTAALAASEAARAREAAEADALRAALAEARAAAAGAEARAAAAGAGTSGAAPAPAPAPAPRRRAAADEPGGAGDSPAPPSARLPPRSARIDRTPPRDQDECGLASARSHAGEPGALSPFEPQGSVEPTPRATPRSGRKLSGAGLPPRESVSSMKHLERLASARQFGTYRPGVSSSSSSAAGAAIGLRGEGGSALKAEASRLTARERGGEAASGGSPAAPPRASLPASRSSSSSGVPQTARLGGVIRSRASEVPLPSAALTARQGGVFGGGRASAAPRRPRPVPPPPAAPPPAEAGRAGRRLGQGP
ncbi:KIN14F [Scenedesmus sp. PABB004]|nr:KIN14F [Scenedesmus sp. PABB004]